MTKAILLASVCLGILASSARAVDWSAKSSLSESVEANDNRRMQPESAGNSYTSLSSLVFDATAMMPTARLNLNGNLKYRAYAGPGEENTKNTLDNSVGVNFEKTEKRTTYNLTASRSETETASIQLQETGVATLAGSTIVTTYGGGLKHQLGRRDSIAWQTTYSTTEFTSSNATASQRLTNTLDWTHRYSSITDFTPSLTFQQLTFDSGAEVKFWTAMMGMKTQLSKRTQLQATVGGAYLDSKQGEIAITDSTGLTAGSAVDWLASMRLTHELRSDLKLSFNAARTIGPTTFGEFLTSETVGTGVSYQINRASSLSLTGSFSRQKSTATNSADLINAGIVYSRKLARQSQMQLSYGYAQRQANGTLAQSNSVLFTLTRDTVLLP